MAAAKASAKRIKVDAEDAPNVKVEASTSGSAEVPSVRDSIAMCYDRDPYASVCRGSRRLSRSNFTLSLDSLAWCLLSSRTHGMPLWRECQWARMIPGWLLIMETMRPSTQPSRWRVLPSHRAQIPLHQRLRFEHGPARQCLQCGRPRARRVRVSPLSAAGSPTRTSTTSLARTSPPS